MLSSLPVFRLRPFWVRLLLCGLFALLFALPPAPAAAQQGGPIVTISPSWGWRCRSWIDIFHLSWVGDFIITPPPGGANRGGAQPNGAGGGGGYTISWKVDGVTVPGQTLPSLAYCFSPGPHTVTGTLSDGGGHSASGNYTGFWFDCQDCLPMPFVAPLATPNPGCVGEPITFTATATGFCNPGPLTFTWNFGDGSPPVSGMPVFHAYTQAGTYQVTVTVTDPLGVIATRTIQVNVQVCGGGLPAPQPGDWWYTPGGGFCPTCVAGAIADLFTGNVLSTTTDPVPTRGWPLLNNIHVQGQALETGRPAGRATFTYDMHVTTGAFYSGSCTPTTHQFLVDGDGTRYDFGLPAGVWTRRIRGAFCTLTKNADGSFFLFNAGPPEAVGAGGNFAYYFTAGGQLQQIVDDAGNTQTLAYTGGNLTSVTDDRSNKVLTFVWTGGKISSIVQGGGRQQTLLTYSGNNVTRVESRDNLNNVLAATDYTWTAEGAINSITRDGTTVTFTYALYAAVDCASSVPVVTGALVNGVQKLRVEAGVAVAPAFRSIFVTNAQSGKIRYDFDNRGNLITVVLPSLQGAGQGMVSRFAYSLDDLVTKAEAGNANRVSTAEYDGNGNLTKVTAPWGANWQATYIGFDPLTATDPFNAVDQLFYNAPGQPHLPSRAKDAGFTQDGTTAYSQWDFLYNGFGQGTQTNPPANSGLNAGTAVYYENGMFEPLAYYGWPKSATDGNGNVVTFDTYDTLGDLLTASVYLTPGNLNTKRTTTFTYDGLQRVTSVTRPDGKSASLVYSGTHLDHSIDAAGTRVDYTFCNICGALTDLWGPTVNGAQWTQHWTYDDDGNLTVFTDARGKATTYAYGLADELKTATLPNSPPTQFSYNNLGDLTYVSTGPFSSSLIYNQIGQVQNVNAARTDVQNSDMSVSFVYDNDGSVKQVYDAAGNTKWFYHPNGWLLATERTFTGLNAVQRLEYKYNPAGLQTSLIWKNGGTVVASWTYGYDAGGRLTSVQNSFSETTTFGYDALDRLVTQSNANTTALTVAYNDGTNAAPGTGWPSSLTYKKGPTNVFASYALTYDGGQNTVGNLTGVSEFGGSTASFGYDALYRLTSETRTGANAYTNSYGYDLAGNRTSVTTGGTARTFAFDNANKSQTVTGGDSFLYDGAGNLTNWRPQGLAGDYTATYNAFGQVSQLGGGGSVAVSNFAYDASGLRVKSSGVDTPSVASRYYVFDGDTLIGEIDFNGNPTAAYTWGANGLVSTRTAATGQTLGNGTSLWHHFGPQGETRQITDTLGNSVATFTYDAWGQTIASTGTASTPFRYGGQFGYYTHNTQTGLILCGLRWYDPKQGRWTTRDPIGYEGGSNLYEYCDSDPVNGIDPTGLDDEEDDLLNYGRLSMGAGLKIRKNVNKEIYQRAKTAGNVVATAADLHPFSPALKAYYGKDNSVQPQRLSTGERAFNGACVAAAVVGSSGVLGELPKVIQGGSSRLGKLPVRLQNWRIAYTLEKRGWTVTHGGGYMAEEYVKTLGRKSGNYIDITAVKNGRVLRVNTVTVNKKGKMSQQEIDAMKKIRRFILDEGKKSHLLNIPKSR